MQEGRTDSEFHLVVTGIWCDGRRHYDKASKAALARVCLEPGVSLAGMTLRHGVNANLLRKWMLKYQLSSDATSPLSPASALSAFVPVLLADCGVATIAQGKRTPIRPAVAKVPPPTMVSVPLARLRGRTVRLSAACA